MGRVAGGNVIYGRGLLQGGCPDFLKAEMSSGSLLYLGLTSVQKEPLDILADISLLSLKSKYYLKLMEICIEDKFTSVRQDANALASFIKIFCETYKEENLGASYLILLSKSLNLEALSSMILPDEFTQKLRNIELKSQIKTLKDFIIGLLESLPEIVEPELEQEVEAVK